MIDKRRKSMSKYNFEPELRSFNIRSGGSSGHNRESGMSAPMQTLVWT